MGPRFLKIAVAYLVIGATLGLVMGLRQNFALAPVHAHINLVGWTSLALAGVVYHLYPASAATRLARIHFWLHNLGLPVFMVALAILLSGYEAAGPAVGIAASMTLVGLIMFAVNVWRTVRVSA